MSFHSRITLSSRGISFLALALLTIQAASPSVYADAVSEGLSVGTPAQIVPGVALIRLAESPAKQVEPKAKANPREQSVLHEIESRTGIRLTLDKVAPVGFGLYRLRPIHIDHSRGIPTEEETAQLIEQLARDPAIDLISANKWYRPLIAPNDAQYTDMWPLEMIHASAGWNYTTGDSAQRIGVIDTGLIRQHEDLQSKDKAGYDFISYHDVAQDGDGRDADYTDEGDGGFCQGFGHMPDSWHGTHVSGTILASTNNQIGIAGLNWGAQLVTVRALGRCGGDSFDIMSGALWLTGYPIEGVPTLPEEDHVSVMNLSLGSFGYCTEFEQEIIDTINGRDAVFVAATGNDGAAVGSPANCTGVISVAAMGPSGNLASYSSFGPEVEIIAPGGDGAFEVDGVVSASGPGVSDYAYQQGTSMAAPHVAGAISLVQSLDSSITGYQEVKELLNQGVSCGNCSNLPALRLDLMLEDVAPIEDPGEDTPDPEDDIFEENDTFDTAALIHCGDELDLYAGPLDYDFFSFTSDADTPVQVDIMSSNGADLDLYLVKGMNFPGDVILASESPTGTESLQFTSTGEEMVLLVNPWYNQQTNTYNNDDYQLHIQCVSQDEMNDGSGDEGADIDVDAAEDDDQESNNAPEEATRIRCGDQEDLVLKDDDWFVVRMDDHSKLSVTTTATHTPANFAIYSKDNLQSPLSEAKGTDLVQHLEAESLSLGDYFIHVNFEDRSTFYALDIQCEAMPTVDSAGCQHLGMSSKGQPMVAFGLAGLGFFVLLGRRNRRVRGRP